MAEMSAKERLMKRISGWGVVAVIRAPAAEMLVDIARALLTGGVPTIEVTMSTPDAIDGIRNLAEMFGDQIVLGVGTVLDAETCEAAIEAGAEFVVSPAFDPEVVAMTLRHGKLSIPGALRPTETLRAWDGG